MAVRIIIDIPTDDQPCSVMDWLVKTIKESPVTNPYAIPGVKMSAYELNLLSAVERLGMI